MAAKLPKVSINGRTVPSGPNKAKSQLKSSIREKTNKKMTHCPVFCSNGVDALLPPAEVPGSACVVILTRLLPDPRLTTKKKKVPSQNTGLLREQFFALTCD